MLFFLPLKEFAATKEEKKAFLDQTNAEFDALMAVPSTKDLVPAPLAAQHDLSNKHWEDLCKRQDMEEQAEQVCVCVCMCACVHECIYVRVCTSASTVYAVKKLT